jgi:carboxypeptidase PM20D1
MPLTFLIIPLVLIIFVIAFILVRTSAFLRPSEPVAPVDLPEVDADFVAGHLAEAVRCETISTIEGTATSSDLGALRELRRVLEVQYPRVHATLEREIISDASLLYTWRGSNLDLPPVLFCAHLDVVPVDPGSLDQWEHPPFAGVVADDYVWGRGSFDIKCQVIALLEAAELLLKDDFRPERTIYFGFGQDEEIGGEKGAKQIAAHLAERGDPLEAVLDEGGVITQGIIPGIETPVAMIGIAEKGSLSLRIKAVAKPGHSSTPEKTTAIGILARAITALESHPLPPRLDFMRIVYSALGSAVSPRLQAEFANTWLFGSHLRNRLEANKTTNASIRTTTAVTMISGGIKDNLLPASAEAVANFRLLPGDTVEDLAEYCRLVINDPRVTVEPIPENAWEASPLTDPTGEAFQSLATTIRQVFPGAETAPYVVLGATDARHYANLSDQVLRFTPLVTTQDDLSRMHGINERVHVGSLARMVQFYMQLINAWTGAGLETVKVEMPDEAPGI